MVAFPPPFSNPGSSPMPPLFPPPTSHPQCLLRKGQVSVNV